MEISIKQFLSIHELGGRDNQEDWIYPEIDNGNDDSHLFIVCDGMGGYERGEVASKLVCETIVLYIKEHHTEESVFDDNILREAINKAFDKLDALNPDDNSKRMGTTLALVLFHKGGCTMAHIGDSRIYHIRPLERRIIYKSRDHSLVYDLLQAGEITLKEMKDYPKKNVITRAIMANMEERPMASIAHTADAFPGDCFFLCSDGMLEKMDDNQLLDILCSDSPIEAKTAQLLSDSQENADNHSAHLIYIGDIAEEEGDDYLLNDEETVRFNAVLLEKECEIHESVAEESLSKKNELKSKQSIKIPFTSSLLENVKNFIFFLLGFICAIIMSKCC